MEYAHLKTIEIKNSIGTYNLVLRGFTASDNRVYFQTVLEAEWTKRLLLQSEPVASWKIAKKDYKEILRKIANFVELTPHEVYLLNKRNVV